jgi:GNAT superfamily N-acetyltransferase
MSGVTEAFHDWVSHHRRQGRGSATGVVEQAAPPTQTAPSVKGVRRRRAQDLPACARLLRVVHSEGQYPVYWPDAPKAWLSDESLLEAWVAERKGEILGHVAITKIGVEPISALRWREVTGREPSELAGVSQLFVRQRVRGEGIGSALVDVAVAEIRARGLEPCLEVVSASADAIRLYEDTGWKLRGVYAWGNPEDRLETRYYTLTA